MNQESQDVMLGRIDERTTQLLDGFTAFKDKVEKKEAEQDKRLDSHDQWKSYVLGGCGIIVLLVGWVTTLASGLIHLHP